jgi:predicted aldo/keto reductase-like oxidoreductase
MICLPRFVIVPQFNAWKTEGRIRFVGVTHHDPVYFEVLAGWLEHGEIDFFNDIGQKLAFTLA